jgi:hypothetical protein
LIAANGSVAKSLAITVLDAKGGRAWKRFDTLGPDAFPQSLWNDLDAYLKSRSAKATVQIDDLLSEEELFGDEGEGPIEAQPIRESTAGLIRYRVRQFASALVRAGVLKAEEIDSLRTLVAPSVVNAGLKFFIQRAGGEKKNSQIRGIASDLMMMARLWVRSPQPDIARLKLMVERTRPKHEGLPESARRSLAPFRDIACNVPVVCNLSIVGTFKACDLFMCPD